MEIIVRQFSQPDQYSDQIFPYNDESGACQIDERFGAEKRKECEILFVTGNQNKVNELKQMIDVKHVTFTTLDIDLPEIQDAQILNIVQDKCLRAYDHVNKSEPTAEKIDGDNDDFGSRNCFVLVEDTCLNFRALNGMPGPYVKWFMKAVGAEGLHRMLADFEDKSAEAVCIYALMEIGNKNRILFFKGIAGGSITEPRGSSWGWDPIFKEQRSSLTFGEMDAEMKSKFSHRASALVLLRKYLAIILGKTD